MVFKLLFDSRAILYKENTWLAAPLTWYTNWGSLTYGLIRKHPSPRLSQTLGDVRCFQTPELRCCGFFEGSLGAPSPAFGKLDSLHVTSLRHTRLSTQSPIILSGEVLQPLTSRRLGEAVGFLE